jgi:NADPH2:quinone reductase
MRAVIQRTHASWTDAVVETVNAPAAESGHVVIDVEAASLNFADLLMMEGKYQHKAPLPYVPGRDAAGIVRAVGASVENFRPGDRVIAMLNYGAFAQQASAPAAACRHLPNDLSLEMAAACGTGIPTIVAALELRARLQPREWVLISGAAGGMGSLAVSYAQQMGARCAAIVSSAEKEAMVRELGAELVVRSDKLPDAKDGLRSALQQNGVSQVHAAIDFVGGDLFDAMLRCLAPEGRLVIVGFASGRIPTVAANYLLLKDISVIGSSIIRLCSDGSYTFDRLCDAAYANLAAGRLRTAIDGRFDLKDFHAAAQRLSDRRVMGKVILTPQL